MHPGDLTARAVSTRLADLEDRSRVGDSTVSWPAQRTLGLLVEHHFRAAVVTLEEEGHAPGEAANAVAHMLGHHAIGKVVITA